MAQKASLRRREVDAVLCLVAQSGFVLTSRNGEIKGRWSKAEILDNKMIWLNGNEDPITWAGDGLVLQLRGARFTAKLVAGGLQCDAGMCIVFSSSDKAYFCVYRSDKVQEAHVSEAQKSPY